MKSLTTLSFLFCFNLMAEVGRSPAVVGGLCDLDIPTTQIKLGSKKVFGQEVNHKIMIRSDDGLGCEALPHKQYPHLVYEEFAKNEMQLLFQKYPENYSKNCVTYFQRQGRKKSEYSCETPSIVSISFKSFGCEKKLEDGTQRVTFTGFAEAIIKYQQVGNGIEEKSIELVQKEQCSRVKECIGQATDKEIPELKKLAVVACKNELSPISSGRAPAIEKDSSYDGKRIPKFNQKEDSLPLKEDSQTTGK